MERLNIQMKPYQMKFPARLVLIVVGLSVAGFAVYRLFQSYNGIYIALGILGMTSFFQGLNLFYRSKQLFLIIDDLKIEYNLGYIGRPTTISIDEIKRIGYSAKRLRFDFKLTYGDNKKLYLRMIPYDKRDAVLNVINLISKEKKR